MGQATITGGGPTGLYDIQIVKHAGTSAARLVKIAARLIELGDNHGSPPVAGLLVTAEAEVTAAQNALSAAQYTLSVLLIQYEAGSATRATVTAATKAIVECEMTLLKKQRDLSFLQVEKTSLTQEQTRLNAAMAAEPRANVWCTDLTEDLAVGATVGTMEMNGEDNEIILTPGGVSSTGLGKLQHAGISTPAAVFYNKAILPCWQKWKPTYRVGKILKINNSLDTCDVGIEDQQSCEQGLKINQAGIEWSVIKAAVSGWNDFCAINPTFALVTNTANTTITNTAALQADLKSVNSDVNDSSKYEKDIDKYGKLENWALMEVGGSGDCEDFALTKAKILLDLGYPASAIHIEVGLAQNGEGHAWLVVQTNTGDIALDINYKDPISNDSTPYTDRKRQTGTSWDSKGVELKDVDIEYMDGVNSDVFAINDMVVVQFVGQDWTKPKVIGFETNPRGPQYRSLLAIMHKEGNTAQFAYLTLNTVTAEGSMTEIARVNFLFNTAADYMGPLGTKGVSWSISRQCFVVASYCNQDGLPVNGVSAHLGIFEIDLDGNKTLVKLHPICTDIESAEWAWGGYIGRVKNSSILSTDRTTATDKHWIVERTYNYYNSPSWHNHFLMREFDKDWVEINRTQGIQHLHALNSDGTYLTNTSELSHVDPLTYHEWCHLIQPGKVHPATASPVAQATQDFLYVHMNTYPVYQMFDPLLTVRKINIPAADLGPSKTVNVFSYPYTNCFSTNIAWSFSYQENQGDMAYLSEQGVYAFVLTSAAGGLDYSVLYILNSSGLSIAQYNEHFNYCNFVYPKISEALVSVKTIRERGWTIP